MGNAGAILGGELLRYSLLKAGRHLTKRCEKHVTGGREKHILDEPISEVLPLLYEHLSELPPDRFLSGCDLPLGIDRSYVLLFGSLGLVLGGPTIRIVAVTSKIHGYLSENPKRHAVFGIEQLSD